MQIFYENGWNLPEEEEEPPPRGRPRAAFFFFEELEELRTFANSWQDGTKRRAGVLLLLFLRQFGKEFHKLLVVIGVVIEIVEIHCSALLSSL